MKKVITILYLFAACYATSQDELLQKVADETCNYINSEEFKTLPKDKKTMQMGTKILELYGKNKEAFKEDGIYILRYEGGREFGEKVGIKMATTCPNALLSLVEIADTEDDVEIDDLENIPPPPPPPPSVDKSDYLSMNLSLVELNSNFISNATFSDEYGKRHTFILLEQVDGYQLLEPKNIGELIKVYYKEDYFFDLSEKRYVKRKVITYLEQ